jgi:hypothetical protein
LFTFAGLQMADNSIFKLFGFELRRSRGGSASEKQLPSIVPPTDDDGAGYVTASGSHFGQVLNMDDDGAKDNHQLIQKYRGVAMHADVDMAIEEIVNESICISETEKSVAINTDGVETTDSIKKQIKEEFDNVYNMLAFGDNGHDIFRRWYIDGRVYHHLVVNQSNLKAGIQEIRPIDAAKIRKVKQIQKKKDPITNASIIEKVDEFFVYQEKPGHANSGVKLSLDSVSYVTSGLLDEHRKRVVSYLHKALKPINQLRMLEDSLVIYRLSRAPERRIFYIDVGNLPKGKAEEYMKNIMSKYRNKLVYDAATGELKDDRKHMSMLEDFWLPRREGGRGTEITTLPGGENLGQIDDIIYFQKKLYRALNVPVNRLEQEAQFSLGRSTEISRDEVKFQKFVDRLRRRFAKLFLDILKKQLVLKGVITEEDWDVWKSDINVDYIEDNHFTELKETEILRERLTTLDQAQQYIGDLLSKQWVYKNIMHLDDDEIEQMLEEIEEEGAASGEEGDEEAPPSDEAPAPAPAPAAAEPAPQKHSIDINVNNGGKK